MAVTVVMEPAAHETGWQMLQSVPRHVAEHTWGISAVPILTYPDPLCGFSGLKELHLEATRLSHGAWGLVLQQMPQLLDLRVQREDPHGGSGEGSALGAALESVSRLTRLDIVGTYDFGQNVLTFLSSLTDLRDLSLKHLGKIPDVNWVEFEMNFGENLNRKLTALPSELSCLTRLTRLDLTGNEILGNWAVLGGLTLLQRLHLDENCIDDVDLQPVPPLRTLSALTFLSLSHSFTQEALGNLPPQLHELVWDACRTIGSAEAYAHLSHLTRLALPKARATSYDSLRALTGLKELSLTDAGLMRTDWLSALTALTALTCLDISHAWSGDNWEALRVLTGRLQHLNLITCCTRGADRYLIDNAI